MSTSRQTPRLWCGLPRVKAFAAAKLDACVAPVLTAAELETDAHAQARKLFLPGVDGAVMDGSVSALVPP